MQLDRTPLHKKCIPSAISSESFQSSEYHFTSHSIDNLLGSRWDGWPWHHFHNQERSQEEKLSAQIMYDQLTPEFKWCAAFSKEIGSSSWLSVLPLEEHAFYLVSSGIDALCLRYWLKQNTPQTCNCAHFTDSSAMICHMGGFPAIHYNKIHYITAPQQVQSALLFQDVSGGSQHRFTIFFNCMFQEPDLLIWAHPH